jgi:hypothetical protein
MDKMRRITAFFTGTWSVIVECFIMFIGVPIFILVFICGVVYTFVKHLLRFDYSLKIQLSPIVRSVTLAADGLACAGGGEMLNDVLKIKGRIKYGKWYQTISAISGLVNSHEKDTWLRKFLDRSLVRIIAMKQ